MHIVLMHVIVVAGTQGHYVEQLGTRQCAPSAPFWCTENILGKQHFMSLQAKSKKRTTQYLYVLSKQWFMS